jgi:PA14 domain
MTRKINLFLAILLSVGWLFSIPANAQTKAEYDAQVSAAQQTVKDAQAAVDAAQIAYDSSTVSVPVSSGSGLTVKVYNNTISRTPDESNLCKTDVVTQIAANWGGGSVMGCNNDRVTIHYYGTITVPDTGDYRFKNIADDGFYMTINNQIVINEWRDKGCGGNWGTPITLTAGTSYTIDAWFYENGGGACSTLYVSQPSGNWQVTPASWFGQQITTTTIKDPALLTILQQKQSDLAKAQQILAAIPAYVYPPIQSPTNLTVTKNKNQYTLNWSAPTEGTMPERYAIMWSSSDSNGWGIATGNVGDQNALNTTVTIDASIIGQDGLDKVYTFKVRSDNDTLHMYSDYSNSVSLSIDDPVRIAAEAAALAEQQRLAAENARIAEEQRIAAVKKEIERQAAEAKAAAEKAAAEAKAAAKAKAAADALAAQQLADSIAKAKAEALAAQQAAEAKAAAEALAAQQAAEALAAQQAAEALAAQQAAEALAAQQAADKAAADALAAQQAAEALAAQQAADKAAADALAAQQAAEAKAAADKAAADALAAQQAADKAAADKAAADKAAADALAAQQAADKAAADKAAADALAAQQAADKAAADKAAADKAAADKAAADKAAADKAAADKAAITTIGVVPNNPSQLPTDIPKPAPAEILVPHIQVDIKGVENGGIQFFGTQSAPQVVGEDGSLTPPAPPPGSGLPIPPDAITTADTFIGQPGGTSFNSPDIAVPVVLTPVTGALAAVPGIEAVNQAFVAMSNIGNDMSPVTRKKAKKILVLTIAVAAIRRRFN